MPKALAIIRDEHRSLAAILNGLDYLVEEIREGRMDPDFTLFSAMLHYIEAFPEKLHHPKEDEYLFRALRTRSPDAAAIIDELQAEHVAGRRLINELRQALERYRQAGAPEFPAFSRTVAAYTDFHWAHMGKEEGRLMPMAEKALTPDDWQEIDHAFQSNEDPIVGVKPTKQFRELFRRIANLAPAPIGLGPSRSS